jgi:hypothetical protein
MDLAVSRKIGTEVPILLFLVTWYSYHAVRRLLPTGMYYRLQIKFLLSSTEIQCPLRSY